jgi:hypothetical protein
MATARPGRPWHTERFESGRVERGVAGDTSPAPRHARSVRSAQDPRNQTRPPRGARCLGAVGPIGLGSRARRGSVGCMETNTPRRASRSNRSPSASSQAPLDRRFEDPARLAKLLRVIREAIDGKGRLRIRFRGFDRLIQPHRSRPMPLDHYVTLGRSGLRVSPLCLGTMTFGEDWGWGSTTSRLGRHPRRLPRPRRQLHRHRQHLHQGALREHHRRPLSGRVARQARPAGHRDQVHRQHVPGRPERRRRRAQEPDQRRGRIAPPAQDRLHRPALEHFWDRHTPIDRDAAHVRRPRARRARSATSGSATTRPGCARWRSTECRIRGWEPMVGLQIEYSLIERTVEGELIPMAQHLGMGVTPWSPLKGGILTGQVHPRQDQAEQGRGGPRLERSPTATTTSSMR